MEDQIKILRLVTGEDIICKYLKLEKQLYYVMDPMTLVIRYKSGESTILMQHWLPVEVLEKNEVTLQDRDILTFIEPNEHMREYYASLSEKLREETSRLKELKSSIETETMEILNSFKVKNQSIH